MFFSHNHLNYYLLRNAALNTVMILSYGGHMSSMHYKLRKHIKKNPKQIKKIQKHLYQIDNMCSTKKKTHNITKSRNTPYMIP